MRQDWLGNSVTVESAETLKGIDAFLEGFLSYETKAMEIVAAADGDRDCAIANAYAAMLMMFMESPEAPNLARPYLDRAEAAAPHASRREQMDIAAIRAWVDNDMPRAIRLSREIAAEWPHDLAIVKSCQYHAFNLGDAPAMLSIAEPVAKHNIELPYMHGLLAFAYEQCNLIDEAERAARRAIALKRKEPWAHHALAHVMLTQGRTEESREFMEEMSETWTDLNSFMVTHNWWHLSLNYIGLGQAERALELFDREVWGVWKEYSQDQIGAVSLLLRLELAGAQVGDRWAELADHLAARTQDFVQPFLTMQYLYGLARAGRSEADTLMTNLRGFVAEAPAFVAPAWRQVALPACEGLLAHARGQHPTVLDRLGVALPRMMEIGGSHAQRDLFDQVLLDSLIKTDHRVAAQQALEHRRGFDPLDVPTNRALVDIYQALDLPREAAKAEARVAQRVS
ncbi:MAG: tetratricopeptide repeat protein [Rhodospirillales bacterium]